MPPGHPLGDESEMVLFRIALYLRPVRGSKLASPVLVHYRQSALCPPSSSVDLPSLPLTEVPFACASPVTSFSHEWAPPLSYEIDSIVLGDRPSRKFL